MQSENAPFCVLVQYIDASKSTVIVVGSNGVPRDEENYRKENKRSLSKWGMAFSHPRGGCVGHSVTTARTAQEGLERFAVSAVDLVLLDYAVPDSTGDDVAATMKRIKPDVRILMFSGVPHVPEGARLHVDAFLQKGQAPTVVLGKIQELLESSHPAA